MSVLEQGYEAMALSRAVEERIRAAYLASKIRGRLVSGRGQEAIPVGATLGLEPGDVIAPLHRDLGAHLVRGTTPLTIFRHWLGRATGPARGRDSDVHLGEWHRGIFPMVSHLPDGYPVVGGVALSFTLRRRPNVVVAFCGDGATSTGTWHETLNFAAVNDAPIVFVVEDNQYAYSTPTALQFRGALVDRAIGYGIAGYEVDGNDVEAVAGTVGKAVAEAREGGGPSLVVAETMRMEGHAIHDAAAYVPRELLEHWAARDPLALAEQRLRDGGGWDDARFEALHARQRAEVRAAWDQAESEPLPDAATLTDGVYAEP
jgi:TPP-dependent pyruvate/acetoin dehydrogenase alpha subunit